MNYKKFLTKNKFKILLLFVLLAILMVSFFFLYYSKDLPRPEKFIERPFVQSTKIYDRTGEVLLYEMYGEEKRTFISLDKIPKHLQNAVIAAEDQNFFKHHGIDIKAVFRALVVNIKEGGFLQGGSTISQQLIRSSFLTRDKTIKRKVREVVLTIELDRRYSKEQILEWYLNQIPFGLNAYGVEAASQTYFQKSSNELTISESVVLAALVQAPSRLSPYGDNRDQLLQRKDWVLKNMLSLGFLTEEEYESAKNEEIVFSKIRQAIKAPHFVLLVKNYLLSKYGESFLKEKGLQVYTSLDWDLQQTAERVVKEGVEINKNYHAFNASLVALNPKNGEILAMVGSKDFFGDPYPKNCTPGKNCFFEPEVNVSTYRIGRQPGSAFKPFVYATAFKKEYTDDYIVVDELTDFGIWGEEPYIPQNYDGIFRGEVTLRQALAQSLNVPSVKVLLHLAGLEDSIKTAQDLGITTLKPPYGPSIVLGGWEVRLLDIVSAYGVFASGGLKTNPVSVLKILNYEGGVVEKNRQEPKRVLDKQTAEMITDILSDNETRAPVFGKNSVLYFKDNKVAAKTGSTNNFKDGWTIGYTSSVVAGVWVGNNNGELMTKAPGVVVAGPIWHNFLTQAIR